MISQSASNNKQQKKKYKQCFVAFENKAIVPFNYKSGIKTQLKTTIESSFFICQMTKEWNEKCICELRTRFCYETEIKWHKLEFPINKERSFDKKKMLK